MNIKTGEVIQYQNVHFIYKKRKQTKKPVSRDLKNSHINRKLKIKTFIFYVKICTRMKNTLTLVTTI